MTASRFTLRDTVSVALQQVALAAVLAILALAWLHIPDANPFEVLASVLLGLLIVAVAGAGQSAIALRLTNKPGTLRRLLIGTGFVLVASLLWYLMALCVDHFSVSDELRAGYLNSRIPAHLRNILTYMHFILWLQWFWSALRFITAGLLAAAAFACITADTPLRGTLAIFRSGRYWLALLLLTLVGAIIAGTLLNWMPGHGLRLELLSLTLRMLAVAALFAAPVALLLQAMAHAVLRTQFDGTVEPSTSQPRTAGIP